MRKADPKLLEMAKVFNMPKAARIKYIILPALIPGISRLLRKKNPQETQKTKGAAL